VNRNRLARLAGAAALATVLLTGCAGGGSAAPTVTVTVTSTPTSTPTPTPTSDTAGTKTVQLGADGITVTAPEGTITAGYFGGVTPAVDALSAVLGTVKPTFLPAGKCNADQTTYDWGSLKLTYLGSDATADSTFILNATTAPTTVDVSTALGARVGGQWKSYIAGVPSSALTRSDGTYDSVLESTAAGADASDTGTIVTATNGVISSISAPLSWNADC
jgi:hypothetical protein